MIKIGLIGYGYWGPNLVRNFAELPGASIVGVSDMSAQRLEQVKLRYPALKATTDYRELTNDPSIDAIVIATPVSTHFELALDALQAGKSVLVEKPLTWSSEEAKKLIAEADSRKLVLMVDHTFVYTGAVRKIKNLVEEDQLGQIYYYDSVRINLGLFQHDVNVLWDLAVHDLSIMDYILDARPSAVAATGIAHLAGQPEDVAYLTCFFDGSLIAHFHVNWLAPVKIRQTLVGGDKRMIVYNDLEPSEKIKIYDRGLKLSDSVQGKYQKYQLLVGYRSGDMLAPQLDSTEALRVAALHFIDCVGHSKQPITDGLVGLRIVKILETATQSMAKRGRPLEITW